MPPSIWVPATPDQPFFKTGDTHLCYEGREFVYAWSGGTQILRRHLKRDLTYVSMIKCARRPTTMLTITQKFYLARVGKSIPRKFKSRGDRAFTHTPRFYDPKLMSDQNIALAYAAITQQPAPTFRDRAAAELRLSLLLQQRESILIDYLPQHAAGIMVHDLMWIVPTMFLPAEMKSVHTHLRRWTGDERIVVVVDGNPKRPKSASAKRFELYRREGITVSGYEQAVNNVYKARDDLQNDLNRGYIRIV